MSDTENALNFSHKPELIAAYELDAIRYRTDSLITSGRISSQAAKMAVLDCGDLLNHATYQRLQMEEFRAQVAQQLAGLLPDGDYKGYPGMSDREYHEMNAVNEARQEFANCIRAAAAALDITLP